jgi:hypothetical protein
MMISNWSFKTAKQTFSRMLLPNVVIRTDRQTDRQTTAQHVRTYRYVLLELCLLLMSIYLTEAINFLLSIAISLI